MIVLTRDRQDAALKVFRKVQDSGVKNKDGQYEIAVQDEFRLQVAVTAQEMKTIYI